MTSMNGPATMITSVCSAPSPPENSSTPATAPWATPQKITSQRIGSSLPCWLSMPMTIEAESAPVMKKIATRNTASTTVMLESGYSRSVAKRAPSVPSFASTAPRSLAPESCRSNAEPARIENQTNDTRLGTRIT